ncbi:extracellular solute-binding protein [Bacteriovoracaceae bacterium]|nr:extracellular solute-binding protein [Bacteriovoracaceae bacterium]
MNLFKIIFINLFIIASFISCNDSKNSTSTTGGNQEVWVYTSMYKDTINELTPKLKKAFPNITVRWYQAGSEDIASKYNLEVINDSIQADLLISSDRFWYHRMAKEKNLSPYKHKYFDKVPNDLKNAEGYYSALSLPVMVLCYNSDAITESEAPKNFKDLADTKWKNKITTGSPLISGTNFTTMAMLQAKYGWDYIKNLKLNNVLAEGGNSAVLRRIQSKEKPVGWVLLENILRLVNDDARLKIIYPEDGVVTHANIMAMTTKKDNQVAVKKIIDWFYENEGQTSMTNSFMYSPLSNFKNPVGAPNLSEILSKAMPWTNELINTISTKQEEIKEKYTEIMFQ